VALIKVKNLTPGMTLSSDVCDPNGRFLLGKDCKILDKHITALNAWGVISVNVLDSDVENVQVANDLSPEIYQAVGQQVRSRFVKNDLEHPFIAELLNETTRFFINKLREDS